MNNFKRVWLLVAVLIIFPVKAFAFTGEIKIDCGNSSYLPGSTVDCTISASSNDLANDDALNTIQFDVSLENLEYVSGDKFTKADSSDYLVFNNNNLQIANVGTAWGKGTNNILGTLHLKLKDNANSDGKVTLSNVYFFSNKVNQTGTSVNSVNTTIKLKSGIKTVSVNNQQCDFTDGTCQIKIANSVNKISITYTTIGNSTVTVSYNNNVINDLNDIDFVGNSTNQGQMLFKINDGTNNYMVNVYKEIAKSSEDPSSESSSSSSSSSKSSSSSSSSSSKSYTNNNNSTSNNSSKNVTSNPSTGIGMVSMLIVLVLSLGVAIYFYIKNMKDYKKSK